MVGLLPLLGFAKSGLPLTHDGQDHVARVANFYQSLIEGNPVPRWAANLNWGFGHPILMFLYPLPSYLASFFQIAGLSLLDSVKLVFGLSFILSGLLMYLWVKAIWGDRAGWVSGLFYMFAPYRFVDLFVRGAIGECWAFVWPPLIAWAALKLSRQMKTKYLIIGALALGALILSHNALTLMFLPLLLGYFGYLVYFEGKSKKLIISYGLMVGLGFGLAAFFWMPAFFEGRYTLRNIVTKDNISGFEKFSRFIWSSWSFGGSGSLSVQLGPVQWLGVVFSPLLILKFFKEKNRLYLFLSFLLIYFWLTIMLMLPESRPIYLAVSLMQKFQFAWRFMSVSIFIPAIFLGGLVSILPKRLQLYFLILSVLTAIGLNFGYWQPKDYLHKEESFYTGQYPGTTDTGESAPVWSVRFMEVFPEAPLQIIDGEAWVENGRRLFNQRQYRLTAKTPVRLVENTLYFPGWKISADGQPVEIQYQDPAYRGLMTFNLSEGEHLVKVHFGETKFRQLANLVSVLSLATVLLLGLGWGDKLKIKFLDGVI